MRETYLRVEVGHFWNASGVYLPARVHSSDVQDAGGAVECKVLKRTRDVELLVDDLCREEESGINREQRLWITVSVQAGGKHGPEGERERERELCVDYSSHTKN